LDETVFDEPDPAIYDRLCGNEPDTTDATPSTKPANSSPQDNVTDPPAASASASDQESPHA
jgi:hypothetical protein